MRLQPHVAEWLVQDRPFDDHFGEIDRTDVLDLDVVAQRLLELHKVLRFTLGRLRSVQLLFLVHLDLDETGLGTNMRGHRRKKNSNSDEANPSFCVHGTSFCGPNQRAASDRIRTSRFKLATDGRMVLELTTVAV